MSVSGINLDVTPESLQAKLIAQIERIKSENPRYNALLRSYFPLDSCLGWLEENLKAARGMPLAGMSYVVKDNIAVRGAPLTQGLKPPFMPRSLQDASIVDVLNHNGAILFGSSNLDELCLGCVGDNRHFGRVINPVNSSLIAGGSSSGSAVAVARGFCDFAIGSDLAGSVRIPAAVCGVIGLKLSPNTGLEGGAFLYDQVLDSLGVIAANFEFLQRVIAVIVKQSSLANNHKIYALDDCGIESFPPKLAAEFALMKGSLAKFLTLVPSVDLIDFKVVSRLHKSLTALAVKRKWRQMDLPTTILPAQAQALLMMAKQMKDEEVEEIASCQLQVSDALGSLLSGGLLLTPALSAEVPNWREKECLFGSQQLASFLTIANLCGLPAIVFHLEHGDLSRAVALQLVGPKGSEASLVAAAKRLASSVQV